MSRARRLLGPGAATILCASLAAGVLVQGLGDNQTSHYALVRALAENGTPRIDRFRHETFDKVRVDGHWYSNKPPGLALTTAGPYLALEAAGVPTASRQAAQARGSQDDHLTAHRGIVWALGLFGVLLPATALLLMVRAVGDRVEPGFGTAAAVTLGLCTLVLPFSTLFFAHALAVALVFGAFVLLLRERDRPSRPGDIASAGVLVGLAVTVDYPLAAAGAVLFLLAASRPGCLRRGAAFVGGALTGIVPLLVYNWWAFGSPLHLSYSGFEVQSEGLFGVRLPSLRVALELLIAEKGLLVMSPVLILAVLGVVLVHRSGRRAEAFTIAGVALAVFLYNAGFYLDRADPRAAVHPFGGASPGPRLLLPALPFLAVGLAAAWRRFPLATGGAALLSAGWIFAATLTQPLVYEKTAVWSDRLLDGDFTATVLTGMGAGHGWLALAPFWTAALFAAVGAARSSASVRPDRWDGALALAVLALSVAAALLGHRLLEHQGPFGEEYGRLTAALGALVAVGLAARRGRRPGRKLTAG